MSVPPEVLKNSTLTIKFCCPPRGQVMKGVLKLNVLQSPPRSHAQFSHGQPFLLTVKPGEVTMVLFGGLSSLGEREIDAAVVDQSVSFV
jgi:hypothetical protein